MHLPELSLGQHIATTKQTCGNVAHGPQEPHAALRSSLTVISLKVPAEQQTGAHLARCDANGN